MNAIVAMLLLGTTHHAPIVPEPRVEVDVPPNGALVGQRVALIVTLYAPGFFASAPSFDLPSIPGAVVLPPTGSPAIGSEKIDGVDFTTQRHEFAIFAQRPGTMQIPAFPIRFDTNAGFGTPTVSREVRTAPALYPVRPPPGTEKLGTVIAARNLKLTESWEPIPKSPRVGDAFARSVTVTADGIPGMHVPPFRLEGIPGLAAYPKSPEIGDRTERGSLTGHRTEIVTYVCTEAGEVAIPKRTLTWYDLDSRRLKTAELPGRSLTVQPANDNGLPTPSPDSARLSASLWLALGVVAVSTLFLCAFLRSKCVTRTERETTEFVFFSRLTTACHSGDPVAVYASLLAWLDCVGLTAFEELGRFSNGGELCRSISDLEERLYSRSVTTAAWEGSRELVEEISAARSALLASKRNSSPASGLPQLNGCL